MLSSLSKIFSKCHIEIVFLSSQKTGVDISCKLSSMPASVAQLDAHLTRAGGCGFDPRWVGNILL